MEGKHHYLPHAILSLLAFISYLILPLTDDVRVFFGVAKITDFFGIFPANVDLAWELKPLGNRMLFYLINKAFSWVHNEILFEYTVKASLAIVVGLVCYYFARQIKIHFGKSVGYAAFFISIVSLFALDSFCIMEPEWFAVILSFLTLGVLLSMDRYDDDSIVFEGKSLIAALLMVAIISLKGITIFLIPAIFCAWFLIDDRDGLHDKVIMVLVGFVTLAIGAWALSTVLFPNAIPDVILSGQIAFSVRSVGYLDSMMYTMFNLIKSIYFIPAILAGGIATIWVALEYIPRAEDVRKFQPLALVLLWITPLILVFIQQEFFSYHYTVLIFPAVISMIGFINNLAGDGGLEELVSFGLILTIFVVFIPYPSIWGMYYQQQTNYWANLQGTADKINAEFHVNDQPVVLYMDAGNAPYYYGVPSACRYIQPLPVWRNVHDTNAYRETRDCILNYKGNYIISTPGWVEHDETIRQPVMKNYSVVFYGWWDIWQRN